MRKPRVLMAITVYNGEAFVPRCLHSAKRLSQKAASIDIVVFDDASPDQGFSGRLKNLCRALEIEYYRSPRNLGIVRNVNLGLLTAMHHRYDYVFISNSDVIYACEAVDHLVQAAQEDESVGSVTAWSNNVSIYSIPNSDPDRFLAEQSVVDWMSICLARDYKGKTLDIPAGISFSILIPTSTIRTVGLMDPIFGRGYCEETDWSLRSLAAGYRIALAPAAFVYHQGRGSSVAAGMVSGNLTTVPVNEAMIDYRYPLFREQVSTFIHGGILTRLRKDATHRLVRDAGCQFGYTLHLAALAEEPDGSRVHVSWSPKTCARFAHAFYRGFRSEIPINDEGLVDAVERYLMVRSPSDASADPVPRSPRPMRPATAEAVNYPFYV